MEKEQYLLSKDKLGNLNMLKSHEKGNKSECIQTLGVQAFNHLNLCQYSDQENKKEDTKIIIKIPNYKNRKSLCANPNMSIKESKNLFCSFNAKKSANIYKKKSLTPVSFIFLVNGLKFC